MELIFLCSIFNITDPWILVFKHTANDNFNDSVKVPLDYEVKELENVKPQNDPAWHLKLTYEGYPDIQLPTIIWKQTSNPFDAKLSKNAKDFSIVANNLKR